MQKDIFEAWAPIFIPNAQDGNIKKINTRYPAILMDARHVEWRLKVAKELKAISDVFIIDPSTDILFFKDASGCVNFKKLGYPDDISAETLYSDPAIRKDKIIRPAIECQLKNNASVIIAPYLFSENTDDTNFSINLSLLSETIRYLQETNCSAPIFAMLELGKSVLNRPIVINHIVDRYKEDYSDYLAGYIIVIDDLDCERADQESLLELSRLVFQLSENNPVIVNKIGPFGEVLLAIGASGFGSGLASAEIFHAKMLQSSPEGWGGHKISKTYIPEIFDYLNDEVVKEIKYSCPCPACKGSYPKDTKSKKLHFLFTRIEATKPLHGIPREGKIEIVSKRIGDAIKLTSELRGKAIDVKTTFLPKWKAVLDLAKYWEYPGKDKELSELLTELDS